ncbi:CcoQ/FixQ family Cbb3-type cytochrome c oxidase assembly chaperone [Tritonibacter horizontis]|uniref:Cbb3-type cytochrome oxidase component FixQ n=1 Tax=Tritonibacter horizontis TaxID=1768241 RepID=A0A132BS82_9RHOB|nr:CcoQ/FixQ family Cbb3-type cytochrome c oxidase assembly chaperone [Tritonibacter horizontis]KUP91174.1 Cbb3-type cytochrome oxidase component FixQ [Tritonibacter horizontis]
METYSLLRQFADSWMLLFLFVFFAGVVLWAFRPGASQYYEDTASIPFRNTEKPGAVQAGQPETRT